MNKDYSKYKVALCGGQGSGKTTLMYAWANHALLQTVGGRTKELMEVYGFKDHNDVLKASVNSPLVAIEFEKALTSEKLKEMKSLEQGYITDRSVLDYFVYYSLQNSTQSTQDDDDYMKSALVESFKYVDLTVFLSPNLAYIESNGVRSTGKLYYETVNSVFKSVLKSYINSRYAIKVDCEDFTLYRLEEGINIAFIKERKGFKTTSERIEILKDILELIE